MEIEWGVLLYVTDQQQGEAERDTDGGLRVETNAGG
jgi:hypothetical protein